MTAAHWHLVLNHIPVFGTIFGLVVLAVAWGRREPVLLRVALVTFLTCGAVAGVVYLTGEGAEEVVEGRVAEAVIEPHEEAGLVALIAALALGVFAAAGLFLARREPPRWLAPVVLVAALAVAGVMAWTANLGGQISHPELRDGAATTQDGGGRSGGDEYDDD